MPSSRNGELNTFECKTRNNGRRRCGNCTLGTRHSCRVNIPVHAGTAPAFLELWSELAPLRWHGVVQVAVTLREPFSWALSAYNDVCGQQHERKCQPFAKSVEQLLGMRPNPQCSYLLRGWHGFTNSDDEPAVTPAECKRLQQLLQGETDFVKTTHQLSSFWDYVAQTLGVLSLVDGQANDSRLHTNHGHPRHGGLSLARMTLSHRVQVHRRTQLDVELVAMATNSLRRAACFVEGKYVSGNNTREPPYIPLDKWQLCASRSTWHDWQWVPETNASVSTHRRTSSTSQTSLPEAVGAPAFAAGTAGDGIGCKEAVVSEVKDDVCKAAMELGMLHRTRLCAALGHDDVLIVGDSLSFQTFASLVLRVGDPGTAQLSLESVQRDSYKRIRPAPTVPLCNNNATVQYIRNDHLAERGDKKSPSG